MAKNRKLFFFLTVAVLLGIDQLAKWYVRVNFWEDRSVVALPGVLEFRRVTNEGIAFGLLQGAGKYLAPLAIIVAVAAGVGFMRSPQGARMFRAAMVFLAGGALGNVVDRLFFAGKVTDFINIYVIHVFNLADVWITFAAVLLLVHWTLDARKPEGSPAES